jgi:8-oxo-dGTP diphosphatase
MKAARSKDWQTKPMPVQRTAIRLDRVYTREQMDRIRMGVIPEQMEDKWFVYWEKGGLYFHRSWTGFCIYVVHFVPEGDGHRMMDAEVNRDDTQYMETSDETDQEMIPFLIDLLLLGELSDPPGDGDDPDQPLKTWGQVGRAMLGQRPGDGRPGWTIIKRAKEEPSQELSPEPSQEQGELPF